MLNKGNRLPSHLINSLDLDPSWIEGQLQQDKKIMYNFGIATNAIRNGKYKGNPLKQRLKMSAVKSEFIDCFLYRFLTKKRIIVDIIVSLVKDYWVNFNSYDNVMERLDEMLDKKYLSPNKDETLIKLYNEAYGKDKGYQMFLYFTKKGRDRFWGLGQQYFDETGKEPWTIRLGENEKLPIEKINTKVIWEKHNLKF